MHASHKLATAFDISEYIYKYSTHYQITLYAFQRIHASHRYTWVLFRMEIITAHTKKKEITKCSKTIKKYLNNINKEILSPVNRAR